MVSTDQVALEESAVHERIKVKVLVWSFLGFLCVSTALVGANAGDAFNIRFDSGNLLFALSSVVALGFCAPLFSSTQNPLGFAASFYLLAVVAGFVWLSHFTPLEYNHTAARNSAVISWVAFAVPAMLVARPVTIPELLTPEQMDALCFGLTLLAFIIAASAYSLGFHVVGLASSEALRNTLNFPTWMRYAIPIATTALLPFCYAWFVSRGRYVAAAFVLVVALSYYPVTLNKTTLMTPLWLLGLTVLLMYVTWKAAIILSLLLPILVGIVTFAVNPNPDLFFWVVNFRMIAIPASAIDHYNHFFSTNDLTGFCQISIVARIFDCGMPQLGTLMQTTYGTGSYNASLLATEGVASVGLFFAPLTALICGAVIAVGSVASSRLHPAFVFLSASILLQALMNVPLTVAMVTNGGILLFALWFITPRDKL